MPNASAFAPSVVETPPGRNAAAFAPSPPSVDDDPFEDQRKIRFALNLRGIEELPDDVRAELAIDDDGNVIPEEWRYAIAGRWMSLPGAVRRRRGLEYVHSLVVSREKRERARRAPAKRFTTDYAVQWGRKKFGRLIDREHYDARLQRHHDLELGVDAIFDSAEGRVGIQGAGKSERAAHHKRFLERGGPDAAAKRGMRVVYIEFERGNKTPVKEEWWA